jgi:P pilus assembly chaperone PapD
MRRTDLVALLVVPAAALLLLAGHSLSSTRSGPAAADAGRAVSVPVAHQSLTCPAAPGAAPSSAVASVGSAPVPSSSGLALNASRVTSGQRLVARLRSAGSTWSGTGPRAAHGVTAAVDGRLAAGLHAAVGMVVDDGAREGRGLATAACRTPSSQWWFAGVASTPDRAGVLQLANPTPGVTVVDVGLYGANGALESAASRGIALAPGETRSLPLSGLVPGADLLAVQVTTTQGRVSAAVHEQARDVLEPAGVDYVPAAAAPRRTATVTGIPADVGIHQLTVVNPGGAPAVVQVQVLGEQAAYTPSGLESLRVPARGLARTTLPRAALNGDATGLRLRSARPITASVRSLTGSPLADQSFAVAAETMSSGDLATAATPVLPRLDGRLVVSGAGEDAAVVDVVSYAADGRRLARRALELQGGQTRTVALGAPRVASVRLHIGGSGPVAAAVLWTEPDDEGALVSGYPLWPLRTRVVQPVVRYDLDGQPS